MDLVLNYLDPVLLDGMYASLPAPAANMLAERDTVLRYCVSLWLVLAFGGSALYLIGASASFFFLFDRDMLRHPKFLKNQIAREIQLSLESLPWTVAVTVPWFLFELLGYSRL
ncbi:c-5 sterol desaturase, partial [Cladochytrium tenue]